MFSLVIVYYWLRTWRSYSAVMAARVFCRGGALYNLLSVARSFYQSVVICLLGALRVYHLCIEHKKFLTVFVKDQAQFL